MGILPDGVVSPAYPNVIDPDNLSFKNNWWNTEDESEVTSLYLFDLSFDKQQNVTVTND